MRLKTRILMRNDKRSLKGGAQTPEMIKMTDAERPFGKLNIWLMAGCLVLIVVGFLLMLGPGSSIQGGFEPDVFSVRRIAVGPTLAFLGFLLMAFAIVWSKRGAKPSEADDEATVITNEK